MKLQHLSIVLGVFMAGGVVFAKVLKPVEQIYEGGAAFELETAVPRQFGNWHVDLTVVPIALPADVQAKQRELYDQMLVRTYVNRRGERIMLTVASGSNQSRTLQVHRPEVCYTSLGFQLLSNNKVMLSGIKGAAPIPAMQMVAAQSLRNEPVTYWIRVGGKVVRGNLELGLARLSYGLRGYVADGLLFRVSNVTPNNEEGFELQETFVQELFAAMPLEDRRVLAGDLAQPGQ